MSGQDLAELGGNKRRRNRAKVDRELTELREETQAKRRKTASRIQMRAETSRIWDRFKARARRILPPVLVILLTGVIVGGAVYWYLHPQLSEADVREGVRPVTVKIERRIGAPVELRSIRRSGDVYVVEYRVPKGEVSFTGRRARRECSAQAKIAKTQRLPIRHYTFNVGVCRYGARVSG